MARIKAKQAATRSRTKRLKQRGETTRALIEAKNRYIRQLNEVKMLANNANVSLENEQANSSSYSDGQDKQPSRTPLHNSGKIKLLRRSSMLVKAAQDNKKITDYFPIQMKGRENFSYSNPKISTKNRKKKVRAKSTMPTGADIELIVISDDTDEDLVNNNMNHAYGESKSGSDIKLEMAIKSDTSRCISPLNSTAASFKDLNIKSVIVDQDVEILEILPPIPLRDHPIINIDESQEL